MTAEHRGRRRFATIQDVAESAGVSRAAVSKVIGNAYGVSPLMRTKVEAAMAELDYRPSATARALRGRGMTIGVEAPDVTSPFLAQVLRGVMDAIADSKYQLILAPARSDATKRVDAIEALVDQRVDGIIAVSPLTRTDRLRSIAERMPLVVLGDHDIAETHDTVTADDVRGTDLAMAHLVELGHRRIAHLTIHDVSSGDNTSAPHAVRLAQYQEWMRRSGDEARVVPVLEDADAYQLTLHLLRSPDRPTAVFAGHDMLALFALRARIELGLSPQDFSIVGFDGVEIVRHPAVSITTIDQSGEFMGAEAARLLLERIAGRDEPRQIEIEPRLLVGSTSAPVQDS